jgi:hypothetical protein
MWLSKIIYDLVAARADSTEFLFSIKPLISKNRIECQAKYGGGDADDINWVQAIESNIPIIELQAKYGGVDGVDINWPELMSSLDIPTVTSIRSWPTKLAAQEHVDFAVLQADYITGVVEEQV